MLITVIESSSRKGTIYLCLSDVKVNVDIHITRKQAKELYKELERWI
jgi:hypothetical protein